MVYVNTGQQIYSMTYLTVSVILVNPPNAFVQEICTDTCRTVKLRLCKGPERYVPHLCARITEMDELMPTNSAQPRVH